MTVMEGGRRRIDRVLHPQFLDGMESWPLDQLRESRADAEQEEVDLSYARRLLHGRLDLLRAEADHRRRGSRALGAGTTDEMVSSLAGVLADQPTRSFGMGRHATRTPTRVGEHRRAAEAAVADVRISDLGALDDADVDLAIARLAGFEDQISALRRQVQLVLDTLSAELGRRYRDGLADVGDVLPRVAPVR
ncbi:MAG: aerial mycelium formation protein [Kineosporiaceae bacterium]